MFIAIYKHSVLTGRKVPNKAFRSSAATSIGQAFSPRLLIQNSGFACEILPEPLDV